jgi:hypothetical protein
MAAGVSAIVRRRVWVAAVAATCLCLASAPHAEEQTFGSPQVKRLDFIENRTDGSSVRHLGIEARIEAEPQASTDAMTAWAEALFEAELRRAAEAVVGSDFAFVTFVLGPAVVAGRKGRRTFRIVFVREGAGWRRLKRP